MSYTILSSPNRNTGQPEFGPYRERAVRLQIAVGYMTDSVRNQREQSLKGEVSTVHESYTAKHPAAAMAFREVPNHQAPVVLDESTVRASVDVARGDGRRPAEQVQAPGFNLNRQFLQQNPTVNTNYGYNPGDSTHGAV